MTLLLVVAGGAVGAAVRYLTDRAIQTRVDAVLPWGTLVVNLVGSLLLGVLAGAGRATDPLVGAGFCGALTTYSTFSYETVQLLGAGGRGYALVNVVANMLGGLAAATLGALAGSTLA